MRRERAGGAPAWWVGVGLLVGGATLALGAEDTLWSQALTQARLLYHQRHYADALTLSTRAVSLAEQTFGPTDTRTAQALELQASSHRAQGQFYAAEPIYKRALSIQEHALGPVHPIVADSLLQLGKLYLLKGEQSPEAEQMCRRALEIQERALGTNRPIVADTLIVLGELLAVQRQWSEAESSDQRAIGIRESAFGLSHTSVANALMILGKIHLLQDEGQEAKPLYTRALAIREGAFGPDHPLVAKTLIMLAKVALLEGRVEEAAKLCERALAIRERAFGPTHPLVETTRAMLSKIYIRQGLQEQVDVLLTRAEQARTTVTFRALNDTEDAADADPDLLYDLEDDAAKPTRLAENRFLRDVEALHNRALVFVNLGEYGTALRLFNELLGLYERTRKTDHPTYAVVLENYGSLLRKMNRAEDAETAEARAHALRMKLSP